MSESPYIEIDMTIDVDDRARWHRSQANWHSDKCTTAIFNPYADHKKYKWHESQMIWHGRRLREAQ